jgi:hypothetical protein
MNSLQRAKKYFFSSMVFLLCSLLMLGGLVWYLNAQADKLSGILHTIAEQNMVNDQFNSLSETVEHSAADREALEAVVVSGESGVVTFLSEIDAVAAYYNVELETSQLKVTAEEAAMFKALTLQVVVQGSQNGVNGFLEALEVMPYAKKITELRVSDLTTSSDATTYGMVGLHVLMK